MNQKKRSGLILTLLLLLSLTACGEPAAEKPGVFTNQETGTTLSLGMTREEVETALKLSPEERAKVELPELDEARTAHPSQGMSWMAHYGTGADWITVMYDLDTEVAVQLSLREPDSHWCLDGKASTGMTLDEIETLYGEPTMRENGALSYHYNAQGQKQNDGANTDQILLFSRGLMGKVDSITVLK